MQLAVKEYVNMIKRETDKINYAFIANKFNCDYRTVKRYFENSEETTKERKPRHVKKKLDGFEEIINRKVEYGTPAIAIYKYLKEKGYKGGYSTVKNYISKMKENKIKEATLRFETGKGLQCQIDWKESLKVINKIGEVFEINIFLSILGYSRLKYIELTLDRTQPTLFKCLTNMIKYFNGVPKELLFDNMRTVVDQSRTQFGDPVYNEKFIQFAKDAQFIAKSCIAYRPKTKGKVETVARIMNRVRVYNEEFLTLDELNQMIKTLNEEINNEIQATTLEKPIDRFQKEKEYLNHDINFDVLSSYYSTPEIQRKVPKDCLINYQNKKYSVPLNYIGKTVTLKNKDNFLFIYYKGLLIKKHAISDKLINFDKDDYLDIMKMTFKNTDDIEESCEKNLKLFDDL